VYSSRCFQIFDDHPAGLLILTASLAAQQQQVKQTSGTRVVLLGTGTPPADPDRSGPSTAIIVNDTPYLVDFGAGVVRRAKAAVADRGIIALEPKNLRVVFVTHLHSDHTVGYPDFDSNPMGAWPAPCAGSLRPHRHQSHD
jgi:ribonuclease Z